MTKLSRKERAKLQLDSVSKLTDAELIEQYRSLNKRGKRRVSAFAWTFVSLFGSVFIAAMFVNPTLIPSLSKEVRVNLIALWALVLMAVLSVALLIITFIPSLLPLIDCHINEMERRSIPWRNFPEP